MRSQFPETVRLELCCRSLAKNERSSICREAIRYNYPESEISKFPWRKIAKSGEDKKWKTNFRDVQRCLRGRSGMIRAVSERFSGYQICFSKNQRWNRTDSELIFFCSEFLVFQRCFRENQRCSALFQRKQRWNSSDSALIFCSENLVFQRCFRENQLCFRENQRWNSSDSALIFLLRKFPVSELFQRKSALFSSKSALFQRFSGNEQRWNRPESILNQSWSALNVSETSIRVQFHEWNKYSFIEMHSFTTWLTLHF